MTTLTDGNQALSGSRQVQQQGMFRQGHHFRRLQQRIGRLHSECTGGGRWRILRGCGSGEDDQRCKRKLKE